MKRFSNSIFLTIMIALVCAFYLSSCNTTESTSPEDIVEEPAPDLPPQASFIIPFDDFTDTTTAALPLPEGFAKGGGPNHTLAFWKIWWWNAVIVVNISVPVAAFVEAFNHDADWQEDRWVWAYSVQVGLLQYDCELHAIPADGGINWEMYISQGNNYQDFLWYSGWSKLDGTEGTWRLRHSPNDPVDYLDIDWNWNHSTQTGDIKYTYLVAGANERDSYIYFETRTEQTYDRYYEIFNSILPNHVWIEWNKADKNGRIKDLNHFGDDLWHCWDENLDNVDCP